MLPSSHDLTYFLEIAQSSSITAAATRLGISQPSLTLAMQRLEQSVGTSLFIRSRQGVKLTKAGERVLLETRQLINRWEEVKEQAVGAMNEVRGRFSLGAHPSVARYSLPLFLPGLLAKHSGLEISLHHDLSRNITQKVLELSLDIAIVVNPTPHPDLVMRLLGRDQLTLWASKKNKYNDVLICEPSLIQTQSILAKLKRQNFRFEKVIETSNLEVIAAMVDGGCGIGILPTRVARAQSTSLIEVKGAPRYSDEIHLIYRMENKSVRAIQAISQSIQEGFAAETKA
jgi:DNA-binding transcriptional LysR family regulator